VGLGFVRLSEVLEASTSELFSTPAQPRVTVYGSKSLTYTISLNLILQSVLGITDYRGGNRGSETSHRGITVPSLKPRWAPFHL
jgi:hypothetical protein